MSRIGNMDDFAEMSATSIMVDALSLLVVRRKEEIFVYQNSCPHTRETLDPQGGSVASPDGLLITCQRHGAEFLAHSGECVGGPCPGEFLTAVPITLSAGDIYLD